MGYGKHSERLKNKFGNKSRDKNRFFDNLRKENPVIFHFIFADILNSYGYIAPTENKMKKRVDKGGESWYDYNNLIK